MRQPALLVIPAYCESLRLPSYLELLLPALQDSGFDVELLVVDDGSGSTEVCALNQHLDRLRLSYPLLLPPLLLPENQGKGAAIKAGWNTVRHHQFLAFVDADGSIPPAEVLRLLSSIGNSTTTLEAVFSCRIKMLGRQIKRHFHRHFMGRIYATLIGIMLKIPVYDSQCGLKIIPTQAWNLIKSDLSENGFAFDVDLLLALQKHGIIVHEVPIDWTDVAGSKVRLLRDSVRMFMAILRLRQRYQL
jgi:dolichyl-phosphate beta-glucosyltransferase